jgi:hypothetical protein
LRRAESFDVARPRQIEVAPGDKVLIRANDKKLGLINGQVLTVAGIEPDGALTTRRPMQNGNLRGSPSCTDSSYRNSPDVSTRRSCLGPLPSDVQREIGRAAIDLEIERFSEHGFDLTVFEAAFEFLVRRGIQKALGARPMKKTVQKFIGDAIRESLKAGAPPSRTLAVSPLNDRLVIQ